MISVENFKLWYGDFQALKGITLEVPKNQVTAFIGPSGCGKSTLLRAMNRMCDFVGGVRHEGSIAIDGRDVFASDPNELRVAVGMVFQHPNPFPLSIRDNILYGRGACAASRRPRATRSWSAAYATRACSTR